jgi:hypothetical protein
MEQTDIWSINPSTSATFFRTATTVTGGVFPRALILNNTIPVVAKEGAGYRLMFTSSGNDTGITFTINGAVVGNLNPQGASSINYPEVVTGNNAGTGVGFATSTYYYSRIDSIVISGAAAGTLSVGTTGSLALPRCRVKGFYVVGGAGAGSLKIDRHTHTVTAGTPTTVTPGIADNILDVTTPAGATLTQFLSLPGQGILTGQQQNDFSVVVATAITDYTLFCG